MNFEAINILFSLSMDSTLHCSLIVSCFTEGLISNGAATIDDTTASIFVKANVDGKVTYVMLAPM